MTYQITIAQDAAKSIHDLPKDVMARVEGRIAALALAPRPPGCKQLVHFGIDIAWRIRVGDWRIVYVIDDRAHTIAIRVVAHRRRVYRRR